MSEAPWQTTLDAAGFNPMVDRPPVVHSPSAEAIERLTLGGALMFLRTSGYNVAARGADAYQINGGPIYTGAGVVAIAEQALWESARL